MDKKWVKLDSKHENKGDYGHYGVWTFLNHWTWSCDSQQATFWCERKLELRKSNSKTSMIVSSILKYFSFAAILFACKRSAFHSCQTIQKRFGMGRHHKRAAYLNGGGRIFNTTWQEVPIKRQTCISLRWQLGLQQWANYVDPLRTSRCTFHSNVKANWETCSLIVVKQSATDFCFWSS